MNNYGFKEIFLIQKKCTDLHSFQIQIISKEVYLTHERIRTGATIPVQSRCGSNVNKRVHLCFIAYQP